MLKHALALVFLVLAISPFTAPFQTFTAPQPLAVVTHDNGSGSVVAPLITKTGRLTIAPPTGLVISFVVPTRFVAIPFTATAHARHDAARPRVLRL
jgi:hypothetical protein